MEEKYLQRIGFDGNLDDKLSEIANAFRLGKYKQHKIIAVGYEDFNIEINKNKSLIGIYYSYEIIIFSKITGIYLSSCKFIYLLIYLFYYLFN